MRITFLASATSTLHLTSLYPIDSLRITGTRTLVGKILYLDGTRKTLGDVVPLDNDNCSITRVREIFSIPRYKAKVTYLRESVIFRMVGVPRQS